MLGQSIRRLVIKTGQTRWSLLLLYYIWRAFPYPLRRVVTALFIIAVLRQKKLLRVDQQNGITPMELLGTLSFWGVPELDVKDYRLSVDGSVKRPINLSISELRSISSVRREVRMDCVGGFRNNSVMEGVLVAEILERTGVAAGAQRAVFHCADGYYVSLDVADILRKEAFLAYSINDQEVATFGYPLRLAISGKYGYQWAKWVVRIELVTDRRKGYWPSLGLPDRGDVGDVW